MTDLTNEPLLHYREKKRTANSRIRRSEFDRRARTLHLRRIRRRLRRFPRYVRSTVTGRPHSASVAARRIYVRLVLGFPPAAVVEHVEEGAAKRSRSLRRRLRRLTVVARSRVRRLRRAVVLLSPAVRGDHSRIRTHVKATLRINASTCRIAFPCSVFTVSAFILGRSVRRKRRHRAEASRCSMIGIAAEIAVGIVFARFGVRTHLGI